MKFDIVRNKVERLNAWTGKNNWRFNFWKAVGSENRSLIYFSRDETGRNT